MMTSETPRFMRKIWTDAKRPISVSLIAALLVVWALWETYLQFGPHPHELSTGLALSLQIGLRLDLWIPRFAIILSVVAAIGLWKLYRWAWYLTLLLLAGDLTLLLVIGPRNVAIVPFAMLVLLWRPTVTSAFGVDAF